MMLRISADKAANAFLLFNDCRSIFMLPIFAHIDSLLRARKLAVAEQALMGIIETHSHHTDTHIMLAKLRQMQGQFDKMLESAQTAQSLSPTNVIARFQSIESLVNLGRISEARNALDSLQKSNPTDTRILQSVAEFYTHIGEFECAWQCLKKALTTDNRDPQLNYNAAVAAMAVGHIRQAERLFDTVIALRPDDYDAYYNRSTLRKQTPQDNHIDELHNQLAKSAKQNGGEVQIRYALAKEYEDLGDWQKSFTHLSAGAVKRASMLSYSVEDDLQTMEAIQRCMDKSWCENIHTDSKAGPIFILGMPRTGTTLVDRILNSHSQVNSLGEINDFALAMMRKTGRVTSKLDAVQKSVTINMQALGDDYRKSTGERSPSNDLVLIDKTPANFLYIGLIAKALPDAKIINLVRNPMDTCYAIYKTLFRMGYPFSYDLNSLADYFLGYHNLMRHWNSVMPGRILSVEYEKLIVDTEPLTRAILTHCGLEWQDACLSHHQQEAAVATASAIQVRQPIYTTSIQKWKHFETELGPLRERLARGGVTI